MEIFTPLNDLAMQRLAASPAFCYLLAMIGSAILGHYPVRWLVASFRRNVLQCREPRCELQLTGVGLPEDQPVTVTLQTNCRAWDRDHLARFQFLCDQVQKVRTCEYAGPMHAPQDRFLVVNDEALEG